MNVNEAQRALLSSSFHNGGEVWELVNPDLLDEPYRRVAQAMAALHKRGVPVDMKSLETECLSRGFAANVLRWVMGPIPADDAAALYWSAVTEEKGRGLVVRAAALLGENVDTMMVLDDLQESLASLPRPTRQDPEPVWELPEVLGMSAAPVEWVLPGLLAHRERLVLTGSEGHGKSMLLAQIGLCAGFGVSPLDESVQIEPKRVMYLDVENNHEGQLAQVWGRVVERVRPFAADPDRTPEVFLSKRRMIDLANPAERRAFLDEVDQVQPDLLIMGSGYKLADTPEHRDFAMAIQRTADEAKARTGCAVIIEAHAGHGLANDRNGMRPDGSSFWLRWPEFGHGLVPIPDAPGRWVRNVRWRGDRMTGREWPAAWRQGINLPWVPVQEDELEARFSAA